MVELRKAVTKLKSGKPIECFKAMAYAPGVRLAVGLCTQFGFRSGRSTVDALFVARRRIELDWAKAVDNVHVGRLSQCLQRFAIRGNALSAITGLMRNRRFLVPDCGCESPLRKQCSRIYQGCTLSRCYSLQ